MSERPLQQALELTEGQHKQAISDLRALIQLNFQALTLSNKEPGQELEALFDSIQKLIDEAQHSLFGLLVAQQIREEDIQLRRERMQEYQDRIQEKRRAVADKQGVYQSMTSNRKSKNIYHRQEEMERLKHAQKLKDNEKYLKNFEQDFEAVQLLRSFTEKEQLHLLAKRKQLAKSSSVARKMLRFLEAIGQQQELYESLREQEVDAMRRPVKESLESLAASESRMPECSTTQCKQVLEASLVNAKLLRRLREEVELTQYLSNENIGLIERFRELAAQEVESPADKTVFREESTAENV